MDKVREREREKVLTKNSASLATNTTMSAQETTPLQTVSSPCLALGFRHSYHEMNKKENHQNHRGHVED